MRHDQEGNVMRILVDPNEGQQREGMEGAPAQPIEHFNNLR
eukprot:gene9055-409_t